MSYSYPNNLVKESQFSMVFFPEQLLDMIVCSRRWLLSSWNLASLKYKTYTWFQRLSTENDVKYLININIDYMVK